MYAKHCFPALTCALAVGLATGGYAQKALPTQGQKTSELRIAPSARLLLKNKAQALPNAHRNRYPVNTALPDGFVAPVAPLPSAAEVFHTVVPVKVSPRAATGPQARAITNQAIYRAGDTIGGANFNNTSIATTDSKNTLALSDVMDDIYLPAGIASGSGVTLTGFVAVASSFSSASVGYGRLTIYDSIDQTLPNAAVNKLAMYDFQINNIPAGSPTIGTTGVQQAFTIPAAAQITLTHDLSSTGNQRYGIATAFYTTAARTTLSKEIAATFVYNDGVAGDGSPAVGTNIFGFFPDNNYDGTYLAGGAGFSYGFSGVPASDNNIFMELDGTSANNLTYTLDGFDDSDGSGNLSDGGVTFSGLTTSAQKPILFIELDSTTAGVKPVFYTYRSLNIQDVANNRGVVIGERGGVLLTGIASGTYNITLSSPGFTPVTVSGLDLTSANYHKLSVTLVPLTGAGTTVNLETVTGSVALEGVTDLTKVSSAAPLGNYTIQFRTPGTTTSILTLVGPLTTTAGSAYGTFSTNGIPDGTYDIWIKGTKNLAVLQSNVVIASGSVAIPAVTLLAADSNNDNSVDSSDFTALIGAFNSDATITGSGYDPTADFNFDGTVDSSDFTLLIGNFNQIGPK